MGISHSREVEVEEHLEDEDEEFKGWVISSNAIKMMVSGKTGVGKSSLLNGILGKEICEEGDDFDPKTLKVQEYKHKCENVGVSITVIDTPGLQDGSGDEAKYLDSMKEKCKDIHLLLYCISMMDTRSDLHIHESAVKKITEVIGADVWKHSVIVLTFANVYEQRLKDENVKNVQKEFKVKLQQWENDMRTALRQSGVKEDIVKKVVAIPAGYGEDPHLQVQEYWLSNVWSASLFNMKEEAQAAMVKIALPRFLDEKDVKAEDFDRRISDQPLLYTRTNKVVKSGVTVAGAVTGATAGALIGAVVIGIPSFGVFAALGLILGGLVGGSLGSAEGMVIGLLIALYQRNKRVRKLKRIQKAALTEMSKKLSDHDQ